MGTCKGPTGISRDKPETIGERESVVIVKRGHKKLNKNYYKIIIRYDWKISLNKSDIKEG